MEHTASKFPFTASGVADWQHDVRLGGQTSIDSECEAIASNFNAWIVSRFTLREDQIVFVESLDPLLTDSYGAALQYALQNGVQIVLEKDETATKKELNPKVAIMEEKIERWRNSSKAKATGDSLVFKILYPSAPSLH